MSKSIKTKEEILKEILKPVSEDCRSHREDLKERLRVYTPNLDQIEQAMDEWHDQFKQAEQSEAVEFAEWITTETVAGKMAPSVIVGKYLIIEDAEVKKRLTTQELYEIFKNK